MLSAGYALSFAIHSALRHDPPSRLLGRKTTRNRELNGRVIVLLSGALTPLGLTLLDPVARGGENLFALTPHPDTSEGVAPNIDLVRTTMTNENVDAIWRTRHAAATAPCIDERKGSGSWQEERHEGPLATFLLVPLLLPAMLTASVEGDIYIVNVLNWFYAAVAPYLHLQRMPSEPKKPVLILAPPPEATRALRTVLLTRRI
ncbi:hypothetical protein K438DRAFT_1972474 [Mycena galopus ATCC 62051]|nr:hypothetical protein K438DRAFT_1972474 [Mycena galopus ATCC 62051]